MPRKPTRHKPSGDSPRPDAVAALLRSSGLGASQGQAEALALYLDLLMQWNARMNLVGARTWAEALDDLAADSVHLARQFATHQDRGVLAAEPLVLDLGAGAGLPGVPLRIFWQAGAYHMIEPREKRALFLGVVLARLGLPRTFARRCRVEELPEDLRRADLVVSRAFLPWREYLEVARGLLTSGGICVVMANEPPPASSDLPEGWRLLEGGGEYEAPGGRRYFWNFTPEAISR